MFKNLIFTLNKEKTKIGWTHGLITVIGATILGYATMMIYSKYFPGDNGVKIVPSFIFTPLLIASYSIWLLFSKTIISSVKKLLLLLTIFIILLKVF